MKEEIVISYDVYLEEVDSLSRIINKQEIDLDNCRNTIAGLKDVNNGLCKDNTILNNEQGMSGLQADIRKLKVQLAEKEQSKAYWKIRAGTAEKESQEADEEISSMLEQPGYIIRDKSNTSYPSPLVDRLVSIIENLTEVVQ